MWKGSLCKVNVYCINSHFIVSQQSKVIYSFVGKANHSESAVYCKIHVSVLWGNVIVKHSSDFDKQEGFSSEKCVVDYENAVYSGLTK